MYTLDFIFLMCHHHQYSIFTFLLPYKLIDSDPKFCPKLSSNYIFTHTKISFQKCSRAREISQCLGPYLACTGFHVSIVSNTHPPTYHNKAEHEH